VIFRSSFHYDHSVGLKQEIFLQHIKGEMQRGRGLDELFEKKAIEAISEFIYREETGGNILQQPSLMAYQLGKKLQKSKG
jgi:hypothetical protein